MAFPLNANNPRILPDDSGYIQQVRLRLKKAVT